MTEYNQQTLIEQMHVLQSRLTSYAGRFWQLPFTYWAIIALTITNEDIDNFTPFPQIVLAGFGVIVVWALYEAYEKYKFTGERLKNIEKAAGGMSTTFQNNYNARDMLPYVSLALFGIATSILHICFT